MFRRLSLSTLVIALALSIPGAASAGGFEFAGAGTRALGRGGAFAARADDPMALGYNPAMLADLPDSQILLNSHLSFYDACVQRTGTYRDVIPFGTSGPNVFDGETPDAWLDESMPRVCNSSHPGPSPDVLGTIRILPELGIGFGILAPSGVGNSRWGNSDGTVDTPNGRRPSPVRYALIEQDLLLFHPSVGVGWRPADWIRIGLTFQWGIGIISFVNMTNESTGPEDPSTDIRTEAHFTDWFVPAGILSVHLQPHPNFDVMLGGRISDALGGATEASGTLDLSTRHFSTDPAAMPMTPNHITNVQLRAGQPWQFTLAMRYADRIRPRSWERGFEAAVRGVVDDPMYSENFDIELDVQYQMNSQVQDFVVTMPAGTTVQVGGLTTPIPTTQPIPHGWSDVLSMRLGGDWNVVPGMVAARAGFHTEIPFGTSRYQIHDFVSGYRFGLHLGATFRIERFDVSIAYAHVFQLDTVIGADANFRNVAAQGMGGACAGTPIPDYDPAQPVASRGCYPEGFGNVVNQGTYTAEWNVLSLGGSYHFE